MIEDSQEVATELDSDEQEANDLCLKREVATELEGIRCVVASWQVRIPEHAHTLSLIKAVEDLAMTTTVALSKIPQMTDVVACIEMKEYCLAEYRVLRRSVAPFLDGEMQMFTIATLGQPNLAGQELCWCAFVCFPWQEDASETDLDDESREGHDTKKIQDKKRRRVRAKTTDP